jgi:hypothetical protein
LSISCSVAHAGRSPQPSAGHIMVGSAGSARPVRWSRGDYARARAQRQCCLR